MPKPIPVAVRRHIIDRHTQGESLSGIAASLRMPYESVRNVWRVYRQEGRVQANYAACGKRGIQASRRVYRGALWLKRWHPRWGAPLIRQLLVDKWPQECIPHARSLQRWFRQAGLHNPRHKRVVKPFVGRGSVPHAVWEMDSREAISLGSGQRVSWLLVSDEASGAVLGGQVFPPEQSG